MRRTLVLALVMIVGPAVADSERHGVWTMSIEPPSKDGGGLVTALSPAQGAGYNDPSYLIARCITGRAELMVGSNGGWGLSGRRLTVVSQMDGALERSGAWDVSSNGKAVFLPEGVEDFMRAIPDDGKMRIAVSDATGETRETIFPTTGFGAVRAKIAEICRWKS
ncbi:hypothetical protein ACFQI3_14925 [Hansschlegelia quercus]|uniref:Invasion associated locus B family protein n=1 Tax=Hansschlegelia quercus TaxID=2528245 RepID=A0A4Q9GBP3_9HYPH|nr:hypothetical protein [Hansschlegelia quercus]TBN47275.1 hypothetical protein EYR15_16165 [Hansschlegelia quercus]